MLTGTKLEYTRRYNRRIIMEVIRLHGPISRAEIVQITGLTAATITNLTSELLAQEIILETGRRKGQRGQPAVELEINPNGRFAIGFELGRDNLSGVLMNLTGQILGENHEEWQTPLPEIALPLLVERLQRLLDDAAIPTDRLLGVGVAMPGPFLDEEKKVVSPEHFPGWDHFPIAEKLADVLHRFVIVENDVMAAAVGEHFHGIGRAYKDFFYTYLGAGIGGATILNGHPYQGFSPNTGEIGRIKHGLKGRRTLIDQFIDLQQLFLFLRRHGIAVSHLNDLANLFEQQNPYLWEWLNEVVECLDIVLHSVNALLGPEVIFLGGRLPGAIIDHLIERLRLEDMAARASQPDSEQFYHAKLLRATFGNLSSAIGAATLPLYEIFSTQHTILQQSNPGNLP
jgi:predicted NBD/HSP70 family sugar kinase